MTVEFQTSRTKENLMRPSQAKAKPVIGIPLQRSRPMKQSCVYWRKFLNLRPTRNERMPKYFMTI